MTIYDISEKSGVSIATVSRVINGSRAVSQSTREKVLKVIADCGYTPNAFARGLGLNSMHTIGMLCGDVSDPYIAQAVSFLEKGLREHGYDTLLCCTGSLMKNRRKGLALLLSKNVDGVLLVGSDFVRMEREENAYILEAAQKAPVMILNARLDGENVYCAYCDDKEATQSVTEELLQAGKKRILYMMNSHSYSGAKKLEGYRSALRKAGLQEEESLRLECKQGESIQELVGRIKARAEQDVMFDAVVAATDEMAVAALKYIREAGLESPGQVPVIGYNNSTLCACTEPELSSVDNKLQSLCQICASTLTGVLGGEERPKLSVFSGELIRRSSTAK